MRRRIMVAAGTLVVVLLIAARVGYVNSDTLASYTETYAEGEWVSFDGAVAEIADERTDGYSFRLVSAEIMSPQSFAERYVSSSSDLTEGIDDAFVDVGPETAFDESVMALTVEMKNEGNAEGYMAALSWRIVSQSMPELALSCDWDLWGMVDPSMKMNPCFTLRPDTEYETVIPFCAQRGPGYLQTYDNASRLELRPGAYDLILTNVPTRKQIGFAVR